MVASSPRNLDDDDDEEEEEDDDNKTDIDPFDSYAAQLFDDKHWSDLKVIICVASSKEKEIGSSYGQILTEKTSQLLPQRLINVKEIDCYKKQSKKKILIRLLGFV